MQLSDAINDLVGGFTILEGNGRGSGARQEIRSGRGTGTVTAEYNKVATISTIVDDADVDKITVAIADASFTPEKVEMELLVVSICRECL